MSTREKITSALHYVDAAYHLTNLHEFTLLTSKQLEEKYLRSWRKAGGLRLGLRLAFGARAAPGHQGVVRVRVVATPSHKARNYITSFLPPPPPFPQLKRSYIIHDSNRLMSNLPAGLPTVVTDPLRGSRLGQHFCTSIMTSSSEPELFSALFDPCSVLVSVTSNPCSG